MTPSEAKTSALLAAAVLLPCMALSAYVGGCGGHSRPSILDAPSPPPGAPPPLPQPRPAEPGDPAPRVSVTTPEGVRLSYPVWLDAFPAEREAMLAEVRDAGTPSGTTLVVLDPGSYYAPYSPTLLAWGEWRAPSTIFVAWRCPDSGPRLPALDHELGHLRTQDPNEGH